MSGERFFERFFGALDGPAPLDAMALLADDLEFALLYAGEDGRARQFVGGVEQLREFTAAGDMEGWGHHILHSARLGELEMVVGETRRDDGRHIGTFVCAGRIDGDGRMVSYLAARTPALRLGDG